MARAWWLFWRGFFIVSFSDAGKNGREERKRGCILFLLDFSGSSGLRLGMRRNLYVLCAIIIFMEIFWDYSFCV